MTTATETYKHALQTALKSWHNYGLGAVVLGLNFILVRGGQDLINRGQDLQGWAAMVIAGYAFIAAIYLASSPLGEHTTLSESFPGIFEHFRSFLVGGIIFAIGQFFLTTQIQLFDQQRILEGTIALIIGGALFLIAVVIGVVAVVTRPKR